jgi:hypothetical protein
MRRFTLHFCAVALLSLACMPARAMKTKPFNAPNLINTFNLTGSFLVPTATPAPGAAAPTGPNPIACPVTIQHKEFTKLAQQDTIYSIDFDRIVSDGEKCSDPDPVMDRCVLLIIHHFH